jgi:AcrR family transcriptional regulator
MRRSGIQTTPRSQATRERILEAARREFGREGYDRSTIRAVAAAAQIHPSMVMRYFGSKEGLFAAAMELVLGLPDLRQGEFQTLGTRLVEYFLERWEGAQADGQLQSLLRAAVSHEEARIRLVEIFERQLAAAIAGIDGVGDAMTRAGLIASQMLGLAFVRYIVRLPAVAAIDRAIIVSAVGRTVQSYLSEPLARR